MTQPIQEPSTDRALQAFAYARDQIFRRPPPLGSNPHQTFRAYRALSPVSISGAGARNQILFDIWENCNTDIFDDVLSGDNLMRVDCLIPGIYTVCWGVLYDVNLTDTSGMCLEDTDPVFGPLEYWTLHGRMGNGVDTFQSGSVMTIQTFTRSYPTSDPFSSGDQFPVGMTFHAAQITGSTEDIEFAFLDIQWADADICEGPILS